MKTIYDVLDLIEKRLKLIERQIEIDGDLADNPLFKGQRFALIALREEINSYIDF